ncbi:MAG: proton-conducting transporter membrane subunit [Anaerolineales bacterium]
MNSPLIFIAVPFLAAIASYGLYPSRPRLAKGIAILLSLALAGFALLFAPGTTPALLGGALSVQQSWTVLGRSFVFEPSAQPALIFLHLAGAFLFLGTLAIPVHRTFVPVALGVLGLMAAALFVRPFLYAAIFLVLIATSFAALLSDAGHPFSRGAARLIVLVALGMPFILLAGTELTGLPQIPEDPAQLQRILVLLGLGFAFFLSFPPFHFWLADVADDSPPYAVAFVLTLFQGAVIFFLLEFLNDYSWLRTIPQLFQTLQVAGIAMSLLGGVLALAHDRLGQVTGDIALANLGTILIALSTALPEGVEVAMVMLVLRGLAFGIWGLGLHLLREQGRGDSIEDLRGRVLTQPLACSAAIVAGLSLAGLPGLAGFPGLWAALRLLAVSQVATPGGGGIVLVVVLSVGASVLALLRFAHSMLAVDVPLNFNAGEGRLPSFLLGLGTIAIIAIGIAPQWILPLLARSALYFGQLTAP